MDHCSGVEVEHQPESVDRTAVRFDGGDDGLLVVRLPLAELATAPTARPPFCATTTSDRAGRIADRSVIRHMGWSGPTTTLRFDIRNSTMVVVTADGGVASITGQGHLRLPLAVRRRCRIGAGARLLVVAWSETGRLAVCTAQAVSDMVLARLAVAGADSGCRW